jgi:replicative DNA helicase
LSKLANEKTTPPNDTAAEESVLGSILIEPESMIKISDMLTHDDFFIDSNARIYEAIYSLFHAHKPIDIITLSTLLVEKGVFDSIGGASRLAELTGAVPSASHIFEYAQIVKKNRPLRKMISAGDKIMGYARDESKKVEDLLESAEKEVFSISQTFLKDKFVHIKEILSSRFEIFAERHMSEEEITGGIPTGYAGLDKYLSGLHPSDMIVLAARPSMGKTAFALSLSMNMALKQKKKVGIFSLEMSKEQLVDRMFASRLAVDSWKLQKGKLSDEDFSRMGLVMDELSNAPIFIDDSVGSSMSEVRAKARRLQMEHGLDALVVDYLQLLTSGNSAFAGNRVQEISEISRSFKALARELHIPIIALSQLSRAVEARPNKMPVLSDLRESGAIEQDADVVLMMYRDDYYDEDSDRPGVVDILIRKHRNGPIGHCELRFDMSRMQYYDIDRTHEEI